MAEAKKEIEEADETRLCVAVALRRSLLRAEVLGLTGLNAVDWTLPVWHVGDDETLLDALTKGLAEDLGLEASLFRLSRVDEHGAFRTTVIYTAVCLAPSKIRKPDNVRSVAWFDAADAGTLLHRSSHEKAARDACV